jgi:hypothetical protein
MFLIIVRTALKENEVTVAIERLVAVVTVATTLTIIIETTTVTTLERKIESEIPEIDTIKARDANGEDQAKDLIVATVSIAVVTAGK